MKTFIFMCVLLIGILEACENKESVMQILINSQGGMTNFDKISKISYTIHTIEYDKNHQIIGNESSHINEVIDHNYSSIDCNINSFIRSPFYPLFPFSLESSEMKFKSGFQKRDTLDDKVYHLYDFTYNCNGGEFINHTVYAVDLNKQIRYHLIKLRNKYYRIDPITWQKEGGIIFPLRNKIYAANSEGENRYLIYDLVYSDILIEE